MDLPERFWTKVDRTGDCWLWTAHVHPTGYGQFTLNYTSRYAHRLSWEAANGPIPEGMCLDHLCHTLDSTCARGNACLHRRCVNPAHLELVTSAENIRRGRSKLGPLVGRTHCKRGHEFTVASTRLTVRAGGVIYRSCRICNDARTRRYRAEEYAARAKVAGA